MDTIKHPEEIVAEGYGDSDELAILYASMLEQAGIATALIAAPGHLLPALVTFFAASIACVRRDYDARVLQVLEFMQRLGVLPDAITFSDAMAFHGIGVTNVHERPLEVATYARPVCASCCPGSGNRPL